MTCRPGAWLAAWARRLRRDGRGSIALEMALAVPILVALLFSGIEVTRYVLVNQKIERTSATMSDLVAQARKLSEAQIQSLIGAANHVMEPFDIAANGLVVVSSISNHGSGAIIDWQRTAGGGDGVSKFGAEGSNPSLPNGFVVREGENVIVTEVFYNYEPLIAKSVFEAKTCYNFAVFRPRYTTLDTIAQ
ncbi:MAG: pilus assembly protein [Hyphomicrobiales bacterium]|nr:pilus assembly protein [Hyphomicrobiales bacterium]MCP5371599.1 pilus assembly protein [Hyphomicrobiales bacterium]